MSYIRPSLVDEKVVGFVEWREDLHKEDIQEFGELVFRPPAEYHKLYRSYYGFQTREDVVRQRKYLYGEDSE